VDEKVRLPEYYRETYESLYRWFSLVYDVFVKAFFFLFNGGFGGERRWREHLIDWLDPQPGERIVDLCSGTGTLALMTARRMAGTGEVVAVEISPAQVRMAAKKPRPPIVSFLRGDARSTGYPDDYFDRALISGALHELPRPVRSQVLAESHRILRSGGRIVVSEHNKPASRWKARLFAFLERLNPEYATYRDLLESGLEREIQEAGYRILKTDTIAWEFLQTVLAEKPLGRAGRP
jgi:ubiquinone/menaquinone biosynthesis C-methylase UbiE